MTGDMKGDISIRVKTRLDTSIFEILEDKIRDLLEKEGIEAEIYDFVTGNTVVTRNDEMNDEKRNDICSGLNIKGELILGEKIWFNDDLRCRLRICGFTKEQQEKIRNAKFIDMTLVNSKEDNTSDVYVHISKFDEEDQ